MEKIKNKESLKIISDLIKETTDGVTIQYLVDKTKLSWNTVTKILAGLEGSGRIRVREVGQSKLHYWRKNEKKK